MATGLGRGRDDWENKRQLVLESAAALFSESGYDSVSMRDIGVACNLHMSTLYHYFKNKSELYEQVCNHSYEIITETVIRSLSIHASPEQRIIDFTIALTKMFIANRPEIGILERELVFTRAMPAADRAFPAFMNEPGKIISQIIQELGSPIGRKIPPDRLAEVLWDLIWGMTRYHHAHLAVTGRSGAEAAASLIEEVCLVVERVLELA